MLIVALVVLGAAVVVFGAGFGLGCAITRAVTDDDVMTAIRYERERNIER